MTGDHISLNKIESGLPDLDELLEDPQKSKAWALARLDRAIEEETVVAAKAAKNPDDPGTHLDSLYALQERQKVRQDVESDYIPARGIAQAQWFEEARRRGAQEEIEKHFDSPDALRRLLARRALGFIDSASAHH